MTEDPRPLDRRRHSAVAGAYRLFPGDRPTARPEVVADPVDDELLLHDQRGPTLVLNAAAAQIWALCDGSHTIAALAKHIATIYGLAYEEALTDVCECLAHLRRADVLIG